ncbi:MAG: hypothetical protein J0H42_35135 [Rhizobiales bacterium]|nr:hypothetical protein [Hyphomicrobiales bacterium]
MAKKTVLAIGIEPSLVDLSAYPGLTPELVRHFIEAQIEKLRALGYDAESCLIDLGETAEAVTTAALTSRRLDCVVIGAGLREPAERLLLFERILNLILIHAPHVRLCFNTTPADTAEAVQRWIKP